MPIADEWKGGRKVVLLNLILLYKINDLCVGVADGLTSSPVQESTENMLST